MESSGEKISHRTESSATHWQVMGADMLDKYSSEIFGLIGSLLSLSFAERVTVLSAVIGLTAGLSCAAIVAPIMTHIISPPDGIRDYVNAGFGWMFGISGLGIAAAVYAVARTLRDWIPDAVKKFLDRKAGL